ncbi:MAG: hypothetical protein IJH50_06790 [Kiritimatiellae bacterium]|nr:hypothetical protein [Kiritimatiellia bacterium]
MTNEDEMISAEEFFFGDGNGGRNSSCTCRTREKKSEANLFARIKVKMVMRIYGVTRAKAMKIIAEREAGDAAPGKDGAHGDGKNRRAGESFMTAEEFFA